MGSDLTGHKGSSSRKAVARNAYQTAVDQVGGTEPSAEVSVDNLIAQCHAAADGVDQAITFHENRIDKALQQFSSAESGKLDGAAISTHAPLVYDLLSLKARLCRLQDRVHELTGRVQL